MRTDGVDLAPEAVASARRVIAKDFGDNYVPSAPAQIHRQGQERARSARGDPSDRHDEAPARRRPSSRARAGEALRTDLDAHHRLPDGERGARAHDGRHSGRGRRAQARISRDRPGCALCRFPRSLPGGPGRRGGRGIEPSAGDAPRREARQGAHRRDPAFHRAAAPLHRGDADQADGGARHRPPLDLRLDHRGAQGSRLRAAREEAAVSRGQGPDRHRVPRVVLREICRLRFHRRSRREARQGLEQRDRLEGAVARFLERFLRRHRRHQGPGHAPGARQPQRASWAAYFPRARRRRRSAPLPALQRRPIVAEARQIRRLHRLLALSRMQVLTRSGAVGRRKLRRRPAGRTRAWPGPGDRRGDHVAQRALWRVHPAGRRREAQALLAAEGL